MVSTHEVYCKDCGKKLAWWNMFDNIQHEEEWECNGQFRRKAHNVFVNPKTETKIACFVMDGGAKTILEPPEPGMKRVTYEMLPCALYYHTKYCATCARKRRYQCGRPRCKGHLVKVRNKDGSSTRHTHGGY